MPTTRPPERILICGGRDYNNGTAFKSIMEQARSHFANDFCIIQGGARGADTLARHWAFAQKVCCIEVPAQWLNFSKAAGSKRNRWMIQFCKPELIIAFPGGRGTQSMIDLGNRANIPVWEPFADGPV